jgi:hypothetical protein
MLSRASSPITDILAITSFIVSAVIYRFPGEVMFCFEVQFSYSLSLLSPRVGTVINKNL